MDLFWKVLSGVLVALISAAALYAFRLRQLYLVVPKMFDFAAITDQGKIIELRACNQGRSMEEDVRIDMATKLKYELLAADDPNVQLTKNTIVLNRLPPGCQISMIILAEGQLDHFIPTITSKAAKGKTFTGDAAVPPNWGSVMLVVIVSLGLALGAITTGRMYSEYVTNEARAAYEQERAKETAAERELRAKYDYLVKDGWRDIDSFINSEMRACYPAAEFPIALTSSELTGGTYKLSFIATNKTASVLKLAAYFSVEDESGDSPSLSDEKSLFNLPVNPLTSAPIMISVSLPPPEFRENLTVRFALEGGRDHNVYFYFLPWANKHAGRALKPMS